MVNPIIPPLEAQGTWRKSINKGLNPSLTDNAINYFIDPSGNVTVTVNEKSTPSWSVAMSVSIIARSNSRYRASFDLQAMAGQARIGSANNIDLFFGLDPNAIRTNIDCKETSQRYTFDLCEKAKIGDVLRIDFNSAKSLGTYYIKNLLIVPID